jgi:predicted regulator of Ras-like GTPase activity (Roadblock/LC7/MglB family)
MGIASGASGPLRGGAVDGVVVQMRNSLCLITRISEEASLAIVASPRVDMADLAYEMEVFAGQTAPLVAKALQPELQAQLPQ